MCCIPNCVLRLSQPFTALVYLYSTYDQRTSCEGEERHKACVGELETKSPWVKKILSTYL